MKHGHGWFVIALVVVGLVAASFALWGLPARAVQAQGSTIFVDADATGANDGTSWDNAYTTLQPALEEATEGDEIWVAAGTYTPSYEFSPGDSRSATFQLKNGVALYGGFDPTVGDIGWEDRDWENNPTILSGDIGVLGDPADNSYHVFYHPHELALDGTAVLDGFTVSGGHADGAWPHDCGGGMYNDNSSPTMTHCTFSDNSAVGYGYGGGMYNQASSPAVTNCAFLSNSAHRGGGMFNESSSPEVINCTFSGNSAGDHGGGMENHASSLAVANSTFSGNSAVHESGGIANAVSSLVVTNSILWGDSPSEMISILGSTIVTYSDIQGGWTGTGNIDADPLFVDPGNGDYHLGSGSPCIDAGTNDAPNLPDYDFEGDPRVVDGNGDGTAIVDMGGDEVFLLPVIYVDRDAVGANNGTSWEDAYTALQPALEDATDGDEIWVAAGTYMPTYELSPGDPRSATFQLKNGVALFGGFDPSVGDVGWENREWANNVTILSGNIGDPDTADDNSYHVFYHPAELALDGSAVLDGFTVSGGNANGNSDPDDGGGMYNDGSSPTVVNCTFSGNSAVVGGGGMLNIFASPAVTNCTFLDNSAGHHGGGMFNDFSSPAVTNCLFSGNSATFGGGVFNWHSSPTVTNCIFSGNSGSSGGGMENRYYSSPVVTTCTFSGNTAGWYGGGTSNVDNSSPVVINCILWGDSPDEISNSDSQPLVTYSDIQGGYDGTGNIDADPLFVDPTNGDYHLGPGSPCIDAGANDAPNLPLTDFEGDPRVVDGNGDGMAVVDMGVDEVFGGHAVYLPIIFKSY